MILLSLTALVSGNGVVAADQPIEFNRDIRPILSDNCFACHGPDEKSRQAGLRLDMSDAARSKLPSDNTGIVPGKSVDSEIIRRAMSHDPSLVMPPPESGKKLTDTQIELLRRWIDEGATYQRHWSLIAPHRPQLDMSGIVNANSPIDVLVQKRLLSEGLSPSIPADRERLIRRLTLDLTGAPPSIEDVGQFVADEAPDAYEKVVDRLMASPTYGERLTLDWLDAARFADTHGFNNDTTRSMWRWRDWAINAFNSGMPFDQFVTEQLAGDLLPNPTLDQLIATGFNRNHVINSEGGIIPEEYRVEYVADRVHTTATIFLGMSMGCARCHDHKFDPISQRDFFQFFAFFNQLDEKGEDGRTGNAEPMINAPTREQAKRLEVLSREIAARDAAVQQRMAAATAMRAEWESQLRAMVQLPPDAVPPLLQLSMNSVNATEIADRVDPMRKGTIVGKAEWVPGKLEQALKFDGHTHVEFGDLASFDRTDSFSCGAWVNLETKDAATVIARMDELAAFRGFDLQFAGGKLTSHLIHHWPDNALYVVTKADVPLKQWTHVCVTYDGTSKAEGLKLYIDGQLQEVTLPNNNLTESTVTSKTLRIGRRTEGVPFKGAIDEVRVYNRAITPEQVMVWFRDDGVADLLDRPAEQRSAEQQQTIARSYLQRTSPEFQQIVEQRNQLEEQRVATTKALPSAMVMREMSTPRKTFVLQRGQYDAPAEEVQADVPSSLPPFPADAPRNRLGLAQWLLTPDHPLTGRVAVNRSWALFFGNGIVETVEDFGSQGQWPSHMELLDWLATEFSGVGASDSPRRWDLKRLHRLMVTSATYCQSSRTTPELNERDPANKLLARGPRFRLQAEIIRDNALSLAGLLSDHLGGPSVSPYQPAGLWDDVAVGADYEGTVYKQDQGEGLYRRSMYTFWKRTCPPPGLNTFDAPEREFCLARRSRTNTPLQALVLLNDPTYVEAARKLAERTLTAGGSTDESRLAYAFRLCLSRAPSGVETAVLVRNYQQRLAQFQKNAAQAKSLISIGESSREPSLNEAELAAWTSVMSLLLNLDELITRG